MSTVQMQRAHEAAPTPEIEGTLFESLTVKLPVHYGQRQCAGTVFSVLSIAFTMANGQESTLRISSDTYQKLLATLETLAYQIPSEMAGSDITIRFVKRASDPATGAPVASDDPVPDSNPIIDLGDE